MCTRRASRRSRPPAATFAGPRPRSQGWRGPSESWRNPAVERKDAAALGRQNRGCSLDPPAISRSAPARHPLRWRDCRRRGMWFCLASSGERSSRRSAPMSNALFAEYPPDDRGDTPEEAGAFRYEMLNRSRRVQKAIGNPHILEIVEALLGEDCHVIANTAWRQEAGDNRHLGRFWHIDSGPHVPRDPEHSLGSKDSVSDFRNCSSPVPLGLPDRSWPDRGDPGQPHVRTGAAVGPACGRRSAVRRPRRRTRPRQSR